MATATREFSEEYMEILLTLLEAGARTSLQAGHFVSKAVVKDAVKPPHWKPAKASDWKNHVELKDKGGKTLGFLNMASSLVQKLRPRLKESGGIELEGGGELSSEVSSGRMLNSAELEKLGVLAERRYGKAIDLARLKPGDIVTTQDSSGAVHGKARVASVDILPEDSEEYASVKYVDVETGEPISVYSNFFTNLANYSDSGRYVPSAAFSVERPFASLPDREKLLLASGFPLSATLEVSGDNVESKIQVDRHTESMTPHFYRASPLDEGSLVGKVVSFVGRKEGDEELREVMGRVTENLAAGDGPQILAIEDFSHQIERFELDVDASISAYHRDFLGGSEDEDAMRKSVQVFDGLDYEATAAYMNGADLIPVLDERGRLLTPDELRLMGLGEGVADDAYLRVSDEVSVQFDDGEPQAGRVSAVFVNDSLEGRVTAKFRDQFDYPLQDSEGAKSTSVTNVRRHFNALSEKEKLWLAAGIPMVAQTRQGHSEPDLVADVENAEVSFRDAIYDPSVRGKVVSFVGYPMVRQGNERIPSYQAVEVRGLVKEQELKSNGENTLLVEGFDGTVREYSVDRVESVEAGFNDFVRLGEPPFEAYQRPHVLVYEKLDFEQAKAFIEQGSAWAAPDVDFPSREPDAVVAIGGTLYAKTPDMPPASGELNQAVLVDEPEARELLDEAGWQWVNAENPNLVSGKPAYVVNMVETWVPENVDEVVLAGSSALVHEDIAENVAFRASGLGSVSLKNDFVSETLLWQDINGWEKAAESKDVPFTPKDDGAFDPVYDEIEIRSDREDISWR